MSSTGGRGEAACVQAAAVGGDYVDSIDPRLPGKRGSRHDN
jgi:serine phosphatase RsbU (regulator of sigma subunit)